MTQFTLCWIPTRRYSLSSLLASLLLAGCATEPATRNALRVDTVVLQTPAKPAEPVPITVEPTPVVAPAPKLVKKAAKPKAYTWNPSKARKGPVTVMVSLSDQQAYVYRNGVRIGHSPVSTGKSGYETPTGSFNILQKKKKHKSNLYDDADMPFMQRLTWDGIALHAGRVPNYPASHGCIRFPHTFASKLYGITRLGSRVVIQDYVSGNETL